MSILTPRRKYLLKFSIFKHRICFDEGARVVSTKLNEGFKRKNTEYVDRKTECVNRTQRQSDRLHEIHGVAATGSGDRTNGQGCSLHSTPLHSVFCQLSLFTTVYIPHFLLFCFTFCRSEDRFQSFCNVSSWCPHSLTFEIQYVRLCFAIPQTVF